MSKVFLGGTCCGSNWRERLIYFLEGIDYFNPVVTNWTPECQQEEERQREICDYVLYVITPLMTGTYAIAEAVDDSNKQPEKTLFCYLQYDQGYNFTNGQIKSLSKVNNLIEKNGGKTFRGLIQIANFLNNK